MAASGAPAPSGAQFVGVDGLLALCLPFISGFEHVWLIEGEFCLVEVMIARKKMSCVKL